MANRRNVISASVLILTIVTGGLVPSRAVEDEGDRALINNKEANFTRLEKIFTHERGVGLTGIEDGIKKQPRNDLREEADDFVRRTLEELRQTIPIYTGYFALDLLFEIFKTVFVFVMTLLIPAEGPNILHSTLHTATPTQHQPHPDQEL